MSSYCNVAEILKMTLEEAETATFFLAAACFFLLLLLLILACKICSLQRRTPRQAVAAGSNCSSEKDDLSIGNDYGKFGDDVKDPKNRVYFAEDDGGINDGIGGLTNGYLDEYGNDIIGDIALDSDSGYLGMPLEVIREELPDTVIGPVITNNHI